MGRRQPEAAAGGPRSPFATVAVVGCGLIGASFALASRAVAGVERVVVWDRSPAVRAAAEAAGIATVSRDVAGAVADADLVVLAVPPAAAVEVAAQVLPCMRTQAVLTDTASVKVELTALVEGLIADSFDRDDAPRYVGGHPMAGSERTGLDAADGTIFQGATWLLTPTTNSDEAAFHALASHLTAIGARVLALSPQDHDRLVAVASHLPQLLSSTLMDEAADVARTAGEAVLAITGGGFRDVTRLAGSDPELWSEIVAGNRDAVLAAIDGFAARLAAVRDAVAGRRWADLRAVLERARAARAALPGKAGVTDVVDVVVPMPDRPGMLAAVTTAVGASGINVEDVTLRHAADGTRGALVLAVAGRDRAAKAAAVLRARGLACHTEDHGRD